MFCLDASLSIGCTDSARSCKFCLIVSLSTCTDSAELRKFCLIASLSTHTETESAELRKLCLIASPLSPAGDRNN